MTEDNINKTSRRTNSRLAAVKAIYNLEFNNNHGIIKNSNDLTSDVMSYYKQTKQKLALDRDFLLYLISGVNNHKEDIDKLIKERLDVKWKFERLDDVLVAVLRSSVFEVLHDLETPLTVIINEYVDITKNFFSSKEVGFVNGILDKIGHSARS